MKSFGVVVFLLALLNLKICHGALQTGFYVGKCGRQNVESIIRNVVRQRFARDPTIVAALLRMQFHDCFVTGCDASLLLNGPTSEKTSPPNLSVRGYDLIDQAKAAVERACPRVVSCADIIAIATRDAVALAKGINYRVQTGRRDGLTSQARNVNLPGPSISVPSSISFFGSKGGGHTVGVAHCSFFQDRLFNFRNTGRRDPSMNANLANTLRGRCPRGSPVDNIINLDQTPRSSFVVDNGYYRQIRAGKGILEIDQAMAFHPSTRSIVSSLANNGRTFQTQFGAAMIKMGALQVLTGRNGQIRRTCGVRN
ncbi:peroxidase 57-like isoform X2 [Papaver somniferum]|uniref:peroxidase 57-like isoform X2 n=1 Tax=Papaver somniferum TaxID=3469 RepID=UPI000E7034F2|nr:peroxidase 57-like isoform X2 [Papaver somniferum]